jgi:LacI family transcriptional regulator
VGLSPTTVSLALNGRGAELRITPETLRRVDEAARELGYRPNYRARALASKRSNLIAFASARQAPLASGVNELINIGICTGLLEHGFHPVLMPLVGSRDTWSDALSPDRVDGCLLGYPLPENPKDLYDLVGLPMIVVNAESDLSVPHVVPDELESARTATQSLLSYGHRSIAYIEDPAKSFHFSHRMRRDGYAICMSSAGLVPRTLPFSITNTEPLASALKSESPLTALLIYDHWLALDIFAFLRGIGISIPNQLSVITFNNHFILEVGELQVSTMAIPGEQIGRTAAQLMVDSIRAGGFEEQRRGWSNGPQVVRLPCSLMARRSVRSI